MKGGPWWRRYVCRASGTSGERPIRAPYLLRGLALLARPAMLDGVHREMAVVEVVGDHERLDVARRDVAAGLHRVAQPVDQAAPVAAVEQHDREVTDLLRLAQGRGLEELVERAEAARQHHEPARVADEHDLPGEEVVEGQADIDVLVQRLLVRQLDPEPDADRARLPRAAVGGLHDPGAAAGDDRVALLAEVARELARRLV